MVRLPVMESFLAWPSGFPLLPHLTGKIQGSNMAGTQSLMPENEYAESKGRRYRSGPAGCMG